MKHFFNLSQLEKERATQAEVRKEGARIKQLKKEKQEPAARRD